MLLMYSIRLAYIRQVRQAVCGRGVALPLASRGHEAQLLAVLLPAAFGGCVGDVEAAARLAARRALNARLARRPAQLRAAAARCTLLLAPPARTPAARRLLRQRRVRHLQQSLHLAGTRTSHYRSLSSTSRR